MVKNVITQLDDQGVATMGDTFSGIESLLTEYVPDVIGVKDVTYEGM